MLITWTSGWIQNTCIKKLPGCTAIPGFWVLASTGLLNRLIIHFLVRCHIWPMRSSCQYHFSQISLNIHFTGIHALANLFSVTFYKTWDLYEIFRPTLKFGPSMGGYPSNTTEAQYQCRRRCCISEQRTVSHITTHNDEAGTHTT